MAEFVVKLADERGHTHQQVEQGYSVAEVRDRFASQGYLVHWVKPQRVAEVKFSEWTHETNEGGLKLRAPVFMALREDKNPEDCTFAGQKSGQ